MKGFFSIIQKPWEHTYRGQTMSASKSAAESKVWRHRPPLGALAIGSGAGNKGASIVQDHERGGRSAGGAADCNVRQRVELEHQEIQQ